MHEVTYIKVFVDYLDAIEPLGDAERGRLFTSLLTYARTGEVPQLGGNERFLFPMMRAQIDRDVLSKDELSQKRREAASASKKSTCEQKEHLQASTASASKSPQDKDNKTIDKDKDNKTIDRDNSARTRDAFAAFAAGDVELLNALKEFEKMRKSIKKPLTDGAKGRLISKLKAEYPPEQWKLVLQQSIDKCWQDIYPLKERERQQLGVCGHPETVSDAQLESLREIYKKVKGEQ
nr:MAG TPA: hypothetical protein [Caudoviricetes sp.]